jgi:hypothetical protein
MPPRFSREEIEMASIKNDFTISQGWHTRSWTTEGTGPITSNAFPRDVTLHISAAPDEPGHYLLEWQVNEKTCQIGGVPLQSDGHLRGVGIPAIFGGPSITLDTVDFSICSDGWLHGTLSKQSEGYSDGNTGTYAADANPPPKVPPSGRG